MGGLGGYPYRHLERPPGHSKIWEGCACRSIAVQSYQRLLRRDPTSDF